MVRLIVTSLIAYDLDMSALRLEPLIAALMRVVGLVRKSS